MIKNNSKFEQFKTVLILKIQKKTDKFESIKFLRINDYEKPTKKEERKMKATFQNPFLLFLFFVFFVFTTHDYLFFIYVGSKDKKGRKKEKDGKGS